MIVGDDVYTTRGHSAVPPGLRGPAPLSPAINGWAILACPSGAQRHTTPQLQDQRGAAHPSHLRTQVRPSKPSRLILSGVSLAAVIFCGTACNRTDPLASSFEGDEITHLEILAGGETGPPYPRIGDPREVERFTRTMRLPAVVADARVAAEARGLTPMFWVRWASGRECRVRIGDDKKLRFWHLEIPLSDDDHQHLASLVEHAGDWPLAKP